MVDPHLEEDHVAPAVTMPQGTQEEGVEHGHEERDVRPGPLAAWFVGMGVTTLLLSIGLWWMFRLLVGYEARKEQGIPPILVQREVPPQPRLIPNPVDDRPSRERGLPGPSDYLKAFRETENAQLEPLGLFDASTGKAQLPEKAVAAVIAEQAGPSTAPRGDLAELMPSGPSGGTALEDRLR